MKKEEKLYEVLGELLYAVAMADRVIQAEERTAFNALFKNHPYGDKISWSFEYEESKKSSLEEIYNKVINYCHSYGATPIYSEFIEAMNSIAKVANGVEENEIKIIDSFSTDLSKRFQRDAQSLMYYSREERD